MPPVHRSVHYPLSITDPLDQHNDTPSSRPSSRELTPSRSIRLFSPTFIRRGRGRSCMIRTFPGSVYGLPPFPSCVALALPLLCPASFSLLVLARSHVRPPASSCVKREATKRPKRSAFLQRPIHFNSAAQYTLPG
ncbi:hypothetical protein BDZ90DRAFT_230159 [Jaminaea rosea]|uniref:Uncharacterized protein n=1 Tax=Jaminaea rosea TaxID=1569628 RepID=A0A316V3Q8_9BASI|nr:hypothetical protein BDZ90DRAFT_230159 [Jaminaea rosea]PWN31171.1 hypothetical protein BDZ90DRAFT_230159 [Jaminaea rosea]